MPPPSPTPTLQPTPASTPVPLSPGSADRWKAYLAEQQTNAPRAELVKPVPRAELLKLPTPRAQLVLSPGKQYTATMPYGIEVSATYRGSLGAESMLPQSGNALGDTWIIGQTPWVWVVAPGAAK